MPQSYDHNFQNNFNSSQSQWGFTSPESNFKPTCPPYPQFFQDSYSVLPVQNRKPSILKISMHESKQQSQNLTDSQFHHKFQNKASSFLVQSQQNDKPINYEKMLEAMTQAQNARIVIMT